MLDLGLCNQWGSLLLMNEVSEDEGMELRLSLSGNLTRQIRGSCHSYVYSPDVSVGRSYALILGRLESWEISPLLENERDLVMSISIQTVASTVGDEIKAFRSAAVTSENRSTPFARALLANVVSGAMSLPLLETGIVHAFGNPSNAKGKPVATVSGLRAFVGGTATYQTFKSVSYLVDCIDFDAPCSDDDGTTIGNGDIRTAIVGFILGDKDAPANLKQLLETVKASVKAFIALKMPSNEDAVSDNAEAEATTDTAKNGEISPLSLNDRALALLVAMQAASDDDLLSAYDTVALIVAAMDSRIAASADADSETVDA